MRSLFIPICAAVFLALTPAQGATVAKTYKYFTVRGATLEEIEKELTSRGPQVKSTGKRHPGSTEMNFVTHITYSETRGKCRIDDARVSVRASVTLPRWKPRRKPESDVRLIWETLASDIKRHEESHIIIAKNHARELEQTLMAMPRYKTCAEVAAKARAAQSAILARHDAEQSRFDRIETINFEQRIMNLLQYRLERMRAAAKARR